MTAAKDQADFATIRKRVTMQMILDHYGITNLKKQKGDELRGPCPLHTEPKSERAFQVNVAKQIWHCFVCKAGGNVIDFTAKMESCNIREAGLRLWQWFNLSEVTGCPPAPDAHLDNPAPTSNAPDPAAAFDTILEKLQALYDEVLQFRAQYTGQNRG